MTSEERLEEWQARIPSKSCQEAVAYVRELEHSHGRVHFEHMYDLIEFIYGKPE